MLGEEVVQRRPDLRPVRPEHPYPPLVDERLQCGQTEHADIVVARLCQEVKTVFPGCCLI